MAVVVVVAQVTLFQCCCFFSTMPGDRREERLVLCRVGPKTTQSCAVIVTVMCCRMSLPTDRHVRLTVAVTVAHSSSSWIS